MFDREQPSRFVVEILRRDRLGSSAARSLGALSGRWALAGAPPLVATLLAQNDVPYAEPLLGVLAQWLRRETPASIARADRAWRAHLPSIVVEDTERVRHLVELHDGWSLAAVLASHRDGYVRERMVRWLGENHGGDEIAFLVVRANDWVEPVRRLARELLRARLVIENADALIERIAAWSLLERFRREGRDDVLGELRAVLRRPEIAEARERGLRSPDAAVRRALAPLVLESEHPEHLSDLVRRLAQDEDVALRRLALRAIERNDAARSDDAISRLLLDGDLALRQSAQRLARERGIELPAFYREALGREADPCAALFGLGETGTAADAARILPRLDDRATRVRRAALLAIAWLAPDAHGDLIVEALMDPRRRVSRDAARQLERHANLAAARRARIEAIAREATADHVRDSAQTALAAADEYMRRWHTNER